MDASWMDHYYQLLDVAHSNSSCVVIAAMPSHY